MSKTCAAFQNKNKKVNSQASTRILKSKLLILIQKNIQKKYTGHGISILFILLKNLDMQIILLSLKLLPCVYILWRKLCILCTIYSVSYRQPDVRTLDVREKYTMVRTSHAAVGESNATAAGSFNYQAADAVVTDRSVPRRFCTN